MKKADVKIGGEYFAKVTNKKVVVRIDAENSSGGWDATNLASGKRVRIKSAQRLNGSARAAQSAGGATETRVRKRVPKADTGGDTGGQANTVKQPKTTSATQQPTEKRLSCVGAALKVLAERGEPMNAQEMIAAMVDAGYWESPGGKTPHATLYSAIARDLVADIAGQLDEAMRPDDRNLRWRHAHAMNRINALLSQAAEAVDELNNRNR